MEVTVNDFGTAKGKTALVAGEKKKISDCQIVANTLSITLQNGTIFIINIYRAHRLIL